MPLWKRLLTNGRIEAVDQFHVAGWMFCWLGIVPTLEIKINGVPIGVTAPKYVTPGLVLRLCWPHKVLGFDFSFPERVAAGAAIEVCDRRGRSLANSPATVAAYPMRDEEIGDVIGDLTTAIPDERLIFLVNGHRDRRAYVHSRRDTLPALLALLDAAGVDHGQFKSILDFGCGCGRILAGWEHRLLPGTRLYGCDINPDLIAFCRDNIPFAEAWVSLIEPPIARVADASMDFVYAASVFTHVTMLQARAWSAEMRRIVKPGGILMMSYHGSHYERVLAADSRAGLRELKRAGFYCYLHGTPNWTSPGSNDYASYMTLAFAEQLFDGFERIYLREGAKDGPHTFASYQDIAIFRRNAG